MSSSTPTYDALREKLLKDMDQYCEEKGITRGKLIKQINNYGRAYNKRQGNIKVTRTE